MKLLRPLDAVRSPTRKKSCSLRVGCTGSTDSCRQQRLDAPVLVGLKKTVLAVHCTTEEGMSNKLFLAGAHCKLASLTPNCIMYIASLFFSCLLHWSGVSQKLQMLVGHASPLFGAGTPAHAVSSCFGVHLLHV